MRCKKQLRHIVAIVPPEGEKVKNRITKSKDIKWVTGKDYIDGWAFRVFNDEKFDFCPICGKRIDWDFLEGEFGKKAKPRRKKQCLKK